MAFLEAVNALSGPLKDLVLSVTRAGTHHIGQSESDQAEIVEWIRKAASGDVAGRQITDLEALLTPRTYIVSNYLTAADVAVYGSLHPTISALPAATHHAHPSVTRYFDHIQSLPVVRGAADALGSVFAIVPFDLESAPKLERKVEVSAKKKKAATAGKAAEHSEPPSAAAGEKQPVAETEGSGQKVQKKEKGKGKDAAAGKKKPAPGGSGKNAAPVEDEGEPVPSMIDLRVGRIVEIMKHPDADSLYVEQIDIGEETGPRTVVSGLVNYVPIEDMRDKYLVAVCNLKPANMRGVKSFAMVLCATHKDGREGGIELIQPPANSKPGDRVYFEGAEFENATPLAQLNPKKKIFETVQPGFITLESKEAAWVNPTTKTVHRIRTKDGVCVAPNFIGGSLS
ncbi:hypothetical protein BD779DRAFT_1500000 [Infundibulicybe gibba]|nr:hypothetical protein BD779DRAFT_1500000 [Infundibulicybe gibba]